MADPTAVNPQITDSVSTPHGAVPLGRFVWHDLMTSNVDRALRYYADLLGWTYTDFPGMDYKMIQAAGTDWGGFVNPGHDDRPSHWVSHVTVEDVDAAAAKAEELGGTVQVPATDIPQVGRFAIILSPTGAALSLFRPLESGGDEPSPSGHGAFCWHELLAQDAEAEGRFFSEILGWRIEDVPMGELGTYHLFKRLDTGKDAGGMLSMPGEGPSSWLPYIEVDDAEAISARTLELGGNVWVKPKDIPDVGRIVVTSDPTGAMIAFLQPPAK